MCNVFATRIRRSNIRITNYPETCEENYRDFFFFFFWLRINANTRVEETRQLEPRCDLLSHKTAPRDDVEKWRAFGRFGRSACSDVGPHLGLSCRGIRTRSRGPSVGRSTGCSLWTTHSDGRSRVTSIPARRGETTRSQNQRLHESTVARWNGKRRHTLGQSTILLVSYYTTRWRVHVGVFGECHSIIVSCILQCRAIKHYLYCLLTHNVL